MEGSSASGLLQRARDGAAVGSSASGLLQRERGGHGTIRLPAVGARLRANAAGTERNSAVSGRRGVFGCEDFGCVVEGSSASGLLQGAWDGAAVGSSASGLLQGERGGHGTIRLPAVGIEVWVL